jgi:hypothetical protein
MARQATSEVSSDYDDLIGLFERLGNFLKRLDVYINIPPTEMMTDIIVKIMVELLSVLILARKQIKRGRFSTYIIKYHSFQVAQRAAGTYARKIFGDDKIKNVLKRLDRLTQDEGWTAVAQMLGTVHGLDDNMRKVIEGTLSFVDCSLACC